MSTATEKKTIYHAVGKRKTAIARVFLQEGKGRIKVNGKEFKEYFPVETLQILITAPLKLVGKESAFDIKANIQGGGIKGQAEALRLGISRALVQYDESLRPTLREAGFLTRDARVKERKKYGQRGARRKFQWVKR